MDSQCHGLMLKSLDLLALSAMGMVIWSRNPTHASSFQLILQAQRVLCEQMDTFDAQKTHPIQTPVCLFGRSSNVIGGKQLNNYGTGWWDRFTFSVHLCSER